MPTASRAQPRIAVVGVTGRSREIGGAERFYAGLQAALTGIGLHAELALAQSDESSFEAIEASYLRFYDLDLSKFDGVISTKAPSFAIRHANHVCYLMHTMRSFYDMFEREFPTASPERRLQRRFIHLLDAGFMGRPRIRKLFAIGEEVAARLEAFNGLKAEVMRHPTTLSGFADGPFDYLFMPGRLHRWKRVELAIAAMRHVGGPLRLLISGEGEDAATFKALAADDERILFLGRVDDKALVKLYSGALAVLFLPRGEDLGLVTFEAFNSNKPVITCIDSGEPSRLVEHGRSGFVCPPEAAAIADCIRRLAADRSTARAMGRTGGQAIAGVTWESVARRLGASLGFCADMLA